MFKRGIGHVEVVLAFILFTSAVLFVLSFIDIRGTSDSSGSALAFASSRLQQETKTTVISYSVVLNRNALAQQSPEPQYITIELPEEIKEQWGIRVEAVLSGGVQKLDALRDSSNPRRIALNRVSSDATLLHVVLSSEISAAEASFLVTNPFSWGFANDFAFRIMLDGQDFIKAERLAPTRVDVRAENLRQEILLRDGQRVFADVVVKVW